MEREQAQQQINDLREKDISRDQRVIEAYGNDRAGSATCAGTRLDVIAAKQEYEKTGTYDSKASQQYSDAYGKIVNLLDITSVDAQNQQQVKDALTQYAIDVLGVDRQTAQGYAIKKQGMDVIIASLTPVLGSAAASKLGTISSEANKKASLLKEISSQGVKSTNAHILHGSKISSGTEKLNQKQESAIKKIDNTIKYALKDHDITGTLKDTGGNPVSKNNGRILRSYAGNAKHTQRTKKSCRYLKNVHNTEAQSAYGGATDAIEKMNQL
ncbi:hypothetical protein EDC52_1254 [Biostraticola tofi]|uniref:DUF6862 domain-containing protein n=1 Tax=Biostraticola tofi TaxID=466109 RepID=A0A4R3YI67_9GAMM|nr:hypothetical protein EDC52_1254 [Biostraticola tofi]